MVKFAKDVKPGDKYDNKLIITVERLSGGIVIKLQDGRQIYIQGLYSEVWIND